MMKKKAVSLLLALALALGITVPAVATGSTTFSDVPESYWGYADIEAVAEAGLMNGTGGGSFSPEMKVSVAQFLTLLGRLVFPEVKTEGSDWYSPYVARAQEAGLLTGTQVNVNDAEAEISRYDMAVILRSAAKKLGVAEKAAQSSEVTDYGVIPNMYTEAVLAVYGMGLIRGDQAGNFNGSNTMMRAEVATVIMRLKKAASGGSQGEASEPTASPEPEKPEPVDPLEPEIIPMPSGEKMVSRTIRLRILKADHVIGRPVDTRYTPLPDVPVKLYYTPDGGKTAVLVAEFKSPSQDKYERSWGFNITFEAPESWSSAENYENGNGFYFSAETVLDGQRLVTSDLRTDGRAYPDVKRLSPVDDPYIPTPSHDIELTPPNGEKAEFTFQGYVEGFTNGGDWLPGFTIRLFLADGRLIGETVSQSDGTFSMKCEVDALDGGFDKKSKLYYYTASGYIDGVKYEYDAISPGSGNLMLDSLVTLQIVNEVGPGAPQNPNYRIVITPFYRVDN